MLWTLEGSSLGSGQESVELRCVDPLEIRSEGLDDSVEAMWTVNLIISRCFSNVSTVEYVCGGTKRQKNELWLRSVLKSRRS